MSRRLKCLASFVLLVLISAGPAAAEWRGLSLGLRASHDVGSPFVSGTESGTGGGAFVRGSVGGDEVEWQFGAELDIAGYTGEGDSDPIAQLTGNVARRAWLGRRDASTRGFWSLGAGAGIVAIAGSAAAFPLQLKLGVALGRGQSVGVELAAVERLTLVVKEGDPAVEPINGLGLELAIRFGR